MGIEKYQPEEKKFEEKFQRDSEEMKAEKDLSIEEYDKQLDTINKKKREEVEKIVVAEITPELRSLQDDLQKQIENPEDSLNDEFERQSYSPYYDEEGNFKPEGTDGTIENSRDLDGVT